MKTIIENLVAKMEGKPETELPEGTTIRFEIGNLMKGLRFTR
jgi:two-component sensor histidine kinase